MMNSLNAPRTPETATDSNDGGPVTFPIMNDHSRADLALCGMLAFWCGGDPERIDRLFRRSDLMREKWDRRTAPAPMDQSPLGRPLPVS